MSNLTQFGDKTKTVFLNEAESHKLHLAFTAAAQIKKGQPVKLDADGNIEPVIAPLTNSSKDEIIGYSIMDGNEDDEVTVAMRAYAVVFAMSGESLTPGPAAYTGVSSTDSFYTEYVAAEEVAEVGGFVMNGFALDEATGANELIRVALL